jgi:hypothetical protein
MGQLFCLGIGNGGDGGKGDIACEVFIHGRNLLIYLETVYYEIWNFATDFGKWIVCKSIVCYSIEKGKGECCGGSDGI